MKLAGNENLARYRIKWDAIMLTIILNAVYREILRSSLSGMRKFAAD